MDMPEVIQMKILNQYRGQPMKKAIYALEVGEGYYASRAIQRQLEKLQRKLND